jgi:predicted GNAT family N-acyltransferase
VIEHVRRDEILQVRHQVLRPTLPPETAEYAEDSDPDVFHLGVRNEAGDVIACVTFFPEALDGVPGWRFRGMATVAEHRNRGLGGELLEAAVDEVVRRGGALVWCYGRSAAGDFYRRHGFVTRGDEFSHPPLYIPHYVFVRELALDRGDGGLSRASALES